jgi:thiamine-phosphate pyrophosphorylase
MVGFEKLMRTARRLNAKARRKLPALIFMTDERRVPNPDAVIVKMPRGSAVIFRNYADKHRAETGKRLRALCKARGILFLVAGDAGLAHHLNADGVHLPEHALKGVPPRTARETKLVTAAVHNEAALHSAERANVDAVLISPVFATESHLKAKTLGVSKFARLASQSRVAVYALGGVTTETAQRLLATNAIGIAAIGALFHD